MRVIQQCTCSSTVRLAALSGLALLWGIFVVVTAHVSLSILLFSHQVLNQEDIQEWVPYTRTPNVRAHAIAAQCYKVSQGEMTMETLLSENQGVPIALLKLVQAQRDATEEAAERGREAARRARATSGKAATAVPYATRNPAANALFTTVPLVQVASERPANPVEDDAVEDDTVEDDAKQQAFIEEIKALMKDNPERSTTLSVWDFGGQNLFFPLHHMLLSAGGVYVVLINLKELLLAPGELIREDTLLAGGKSAKHEVRAAENSAKACLQTLRQWLNLIYAGGLQKGTHPVIIVATCRDAFGPEDLRKANVMINDVVDASPCRDFILSNVYEPDIFGESPPPQCFFVDNTQGCYCDRDGAREWVEHASVESLRAAIDEQSQLLRTVHELVPIRWLEVLEYFETTALAEGEEHPWVDTKKVLQEATRFELGTDTHLGTAVCVEDEVAEMLQYFASMGLIIHHGKNPKLRNFVVLKPQWLIDAVGTVIRDFKLHKKPCDAEANKHRCWPALSGCRRDGSQVPGGGGRLHEDLLDRLWPAPEHSVEDRCFFLHLMQNHDLIVPLQSKEDGKTTYLVPSLFKEAAAVPTNNGTAYAFTLTFVCKEDAASTKLKWSPDDLKYRQVPPGLFPRIAGKAVQVMLEEGGYDCADLGEGSDDFIVSKSYFKIKFHQRALPLEHPAAASGHASFSMAATLVDDTHIDVHIDKGLANPNTLFRCFSGWVSQLISEASWSSFVPEYLVRTPTSTLSLTVAKSKPRRKECRAIDQRWLASGCRHDEYDVSLTYRHGDHGTAVVEALCRELECAAIGTEGRQPVVFCDKKQLRPGAPLYSVIGRSILNSTIAIALVSEEARSRLRSPGPGVDCLLFEWWLTLALLKARPSGCRLAHFVPFFCGDPSFDVADGILDTVCEATHQKLCEVWEELDLGAAPVKQTRRALMEEMGGRVNTHQRVHTRSSCPGSEDADSIEAFTSALECLFAELEPSASAAGLSTPLDQESSISEHARTNVPECAGLPVTPDPLQAKVAALGLSDAQKELLRALQDQDAGAVTDLLGRHTAPGPHELNSVPLSERPGALLLQVCLAHFEGLLDDNTTDAVPLGLWKAVLGSTESFFQEQLDQTRANRSLIEEQAAALVDNSEAMYAKTMVQVRRSTGFDDHHETMSKLATRVETRLRDQPPGNDAVCRCAGAPGKAPVPLQRDTGILDIHRAGNTVLPRFKRFVQDIADGTKCEFGAGPRKKLWRTIEKRGISTDVGASLRDGSAVIDIVRGTIIMDDFGNGNQFLDFLLGCDASEGSEFEATGYAERHGNITIVRAKNKWAKPAAGGWCCGQIYFYFADDPDRHICELQVVDGRMQRQRKSIPNQAYDKYSRNRCFRELLGVVNEQDRLAAEAKENGRQAADEPVVAPLRVPQSGGLSDVGTAVKPSVASTASAKVTTAAADVAGGVVDGSIPPKNLKEVAHQITRRLGFDEMNTMSLKEVVQFCTEHWPLPSSRSKLKDRLHYYWIQMCGGLVPGQLPLLSIAKEIGETLGLEEGASLHAVVVEARNQIEQEEGEANMTALQQLLLFHSELC